MTTNTTLMIQLSEADLEQLIARGVAAALDVVENDGFLDVDGAAKYLSCTPEAIRQRVKRGELPVCRLGKRLLFEKAALAALVRAAA